MPRSPRRSAPRPTGSVLLAVVVTLLAGAAGPAAAAPVPVPAAAPTGFVLPVPPPVVVLVPYDPPPVRYAAGHRGVDLAAAPGTAVVAAGPGRVVFAGPVVDRGVVSIEHAGGLRTTYEPVTATVPAGTTVVAGTPIGVLDPGHPRCAPAGCLHWGARLPDGTYLDPMALLRPWTVRLWPWAGRAP